MFYLIALMGTIVAAIGGFYVYWTVHDNKEDLVRNHKYNKHLFQSCIIMSIGITLIVFAFIGTAHGELIIKQIFAGGKKGYWLITDDSGGKVMRHWILEKGYVKTCSQTDGWKFSDANGNLHYVSGDSHVAQLKNDPDYVEEFRKTFKKLYSIPEDQPTLK